MPTRRMSSTARAAIGWADVKLTALSCEAVAAVGPLRTFVSDVGWSVITPPGRFTALMSPVAVLRTTPPPLLRSVKRPTVLIRHHSGSSTSRATVDSRPRASGGRRSEVKEEGRAQPGPGDMSGGGHPVALARSVAAYEQQPIVRNGRTVATPSQLNTASFTSAAPRRARCARRSAPRGPRWRRARCAGAGRPAAKAPRPSRATRPA